ncbi:hypothetical protein ACFCV3_41805 [Kribbella sp. NPDC056345]|uniref:hypothetical protein n=1 Tax=Kribbella sp. NPDC056345 TaxID=3345789 RepID=UPI0035DC27DE
MATRKSRRRSRSSTIGARAKRHIKRAVRWGWNRSWSSTKRVGRWGRDRVIKPGAKKAASVAGRRGRAIGLGVVEAIERRRLTGSMRSATYTCGECPGSKFTAEQYRDHLAGHGKTYAIPARLKNGVAANELKPAPAPKPAVPAAAGPRTVSEKFAPYATTAPRPVVAKPLTVAEKLATAGAAKPVARPQFGAPRSPAVTSAAAAAVNTHWNNTTRSMPTMANLQQLVRAADNLADEHPDTAEDLEEMLGQLAMAFTKIADSITGYAEMLDSDIKIDPRVTRPIYDAADTVATAVGRAFRDSRTTFRKVYEDQFAAMESGARKVAVDGFWDAGAA